MTTPARRAGSLLLLALAALVLAPAPSFAARFVERFDVGLGGDENYWHPVALGGNTLLVGIASEGGTAQILDARTATLRTVLTCPLEEGVEDGAGCGGAVAATTHRLAVGSLANVYVFDHRGRLKRRLAGGVGGRHALAMEGKFLLVGRHDAVELFDHRTGALKRRFPNPAPDPRLSFGSSVALVGHQVVVGAPGIGSPSQTDYPAGRVYAFDRHTGTLLWTAADADDPTGTTFTGRYFGWQVAAVGHDVLAGPNAVRLHGRTGRLLRRYRDPDGGSVGPSGFGGALDAAAGTVVVGDGAFGAAGGVHVFDARSGALRATVQPSNQSLGDPLGRFVAVSRRILAATTGSYTGNTRLVGFQR